ncbi:MAG: phosphoglucosamine mutase [Baekduia sp.]
MARRLFGTDGVRGRAGELLTSELASSLGRAAVLHCATTRSRVLVVTDTRESGPWLADAFAAGAASAGASVTLGGVLPTPAAPLLIRAGRFDLAAVVSASHNPFEDNGIKIFGAAGLKLTDEQEDAIERHLGSQAAAEDRSAAGSIERAYDLGDVYITALLERFGALDLSGTRVALDGAHGATFEVAPAVFRALGAEVVVTGDAPDGRNINAGVGSTHPEALQRLLAGGEFDAGFAFDGDGDRLIAADSAGRVVDGDALIVLMARSLSERGELTGAGVAVTVMSNLGLHRALEDAGIAVAVTPVGDRHVLAELIRRGWRLGGEQSGHIIDMDFVPTGDGIASALLVLEALGGTALADARPMRRLPQVLVGVPVSDREAAIEDPAVQAAINDQELALAGDGRVLVRASGTEQLIRVMAEAETDETARAACDRIAAVIASAHGA